MVSRWSNALTTVLSHARGHLGRGIGRALIVAIHHRARGQDVRRISPSVDHDNPATRLHERLGYVDLAPDDGSGRMVLDLA